MNRAHSWLSISGDRLLASGLWALDGGLTVAGRRRGALHRDIDQSIEPPIKQGNGFAVDKGPDFSV